MLSTRIAGIELESCIINASGPLCATLKELEALARSESGAVVMKSCTLEPRKGNEEPRYAELPHGSLQCMGLPNLGHKAYITYASFLGAGKPVIASLAYSFLPQMKELIKAFQNSAVDMIEVNVSCPNIDGRTILGYDYGGLQYVLDEISPLIKKPWGLKLPPYIDDFLLKDITNLIWNGDMKFITLVNSVPDALIIDYKKEAPVIKPRHGFGGLCGKYIKPIGLANVRKFYERLEGNVSIIGVGGIDSGIDAFEYILAGADAVGVATAYEKEGPPVFARIKNELEQIMKEKGYHSIADFKGKLKDYC